MFTENINIIIMKVFLYRLTKKEAGLKEQEEPTVPACYQTKMPNEVMI